MTMTTRATILTRIDLDARGSVFNPSIARTTKTTPANERDSKDVRSFLGYFDCGSKRHWNLDASSCM
jgi:hypothetical protein